jgi:hypothetical protein
MAEDAPSVDRAVIYIPDNGRDPHLAVDGTNGQHSAQQSPATQWPTPWIDLSRSGRYSQLTARATGGQRMLDVSIMSVDEPIDPRAFVFPRFADHLSLPPPTELTIENSNQVIVTMVTQMFFRIGLANPAERPGLERKLGRPIDWSGLQQQDVVMGPRLRRAIEADSALRAP